MKDIYQQLAQAMIKQQEMIVGPLAWSEADKISNISIKENRVIIKGDGKQVVDSLVKQFETLFGRASLEVCRDAARSLLLEIDEQDIPSALQD